MAHAHRWQRVLKHWGHWECTSLLPTGPCQRRAVIGCDSIVARGSLGWVIECCEARCARHKPRKRKERK